MEIKSKYLPVENIISFHFGPLIQNIKKELKERFPDIHTQEDEFARLMLKNLKAFKLNNQSFEYIKVGNYLGGVRWFVSCPKCNKRALKLFLPPKNSDREKRYLCKDCHSLKNTSALMGSTVKYKKVVRPLKQLERIRKVLLRKSMTPAKADPLLAAYERIEAELKDSPEHKLWKLQKEHDKEINPPKESK